MKVTCISSGLITQFNKTEATSFVLLQFDELDLLQQIFLTVLYVSILVVEIFRLYTGVSGNVEEKVLGLLYLHCNLVRLFECISRSFPLTFPFRLLCFIVYLLLLLYQFKPFFDMEACNKVRK